MDDMRKPGEFELPDASHFDWHAPETLGLLCCAARKSGLLEDVELTSLVTEGEGENFMLTVRITDEVVLASMKFKWQEVKPPCGLTSAAAARYVLQRIDRIARKTKAGLVEYAWLRVASELAHVRRILKQAPPG
jgi:hypothetical protein